MRTPEHAKSTAQAGSGGHGPDGKRQIIQPHPGGQVITTSAGVALRIPPRYTANVAENGKGIVYRPIGSTGNASTIRIMDPTERYPKGYARIYNKYGQPINPSTGKPDSDEKTHIGL